MTINKSLTLAACAAAYALSFSAQAAEPVSVAGSTTVLPVMQKISESFMKANPQISVELSGGGSGSGIKSLSDGIVKVAMSSREIKAQEKELAKSKGVDAYPIVIAVDAIVPVVHPSNKISDLTLDQLRKIFTGEISNWKDLGGADEAIVLVSRDTSSGTFETWDALVMKKERINRKALLQTSNGTVVQTVANNPKAIGYIGIGYLSGKVKGLSLAGVKADAQTALNRTWPLARDLFLYTNGKPTGATAELTNYSVGPQGQKLVKEAGFVPVQK